MKGVVVRTRQEWGAMVVKIFSKATQSVLDELVVAFGLSPRCIGCRYIELVAELEMQMIMGPNYDMTRALSVLRSVYPFGANILAEYMGVQAPTPAPVHDSPFAAVIAQQTAFKMLTVRNLLDNGDLQHFRTSIFIQMDESQAWELFLKRRGMLGTDAMEQYVSKIKAQWERNRGGNPTLTIMSEFAARAPDFANMELARFAQELIELNIPSVTTEVVKLTSWIDSQKDRLTKASETAYSSQSDLRSWLLKNGICDTTKVDELIPHLRKAGVMTIENIRGFDKSELKECGFNTVQAIAILKALK